MKKAALLLVALLFAAAGASAQQYKWVDRNGRVQYGDVPPPGADATRLRVPSGSSAPEPAPRRGNPGEQDKREAAGKEPEKQASAEELQAKKENCARAQGSLRQLESGQRIGGIDAKGERYYLDEAQLAQETAKVRQAVQEWCN